MKRSITAFFLLCSVSLFAQSADGDKIIGTYHTDQNKGKVKIGKKDGKYFGTLIWTDITGTLDKKNPDAQRRKDPIVGKELLKGFVFKGKNVWEDGTIYDPESGKTYSCKITREENGNLKVRGFIGVSMMGRTTVWKKIE